jgi:GAF domain-containing protein
MIATEQLLDVFVEAADTLVDDFDLIDFLHHVAEHTVSISGASSVGMLLADENDELQFMAASSVDARQLELYQLEHVEGPCLDCYTSRRPVIVNDVTAVADRWPTFVPRATELGVQSVHAFPMRLRDRVIGALNVFGSTPLPLDSRDARVIQSLADIATIGIIQERAILAAETLTQQLQGALASRVVIEQAKGVVAASTGITVDEAFAVLRGYARSHRIRVTDLSNDIVTRILDPRALTRRD